MSLYPNHIFPPTVHLSVFVNWKAEIYTPDNKYLNTHNWGETFIIVFTILIITSTLLLSWYVQICMCVCAQ